MKITLDALIVFESITRKGSYAAAAKELYKVPSAITYTINKLEEDLNMKLFSKLGRRMVLTPSGEEFLEHSKELLAQANNLEKNASQIASGWESELRIAINDIIPKEKILQLIDDFYQLNDTTNIRLSTEVLSGSWDALLSDRVDLIIATPHYIPPQSYQVHPFCELEFVFVVSQAHPLATQKTPITDEQLSEFRVAVVADTNSQTTLSFDVFEHQKLLTLPSHEMKITAQKSGLCVGSVPKHLVSESIKSGELIIKELENSSLVGKHQTYFALRKNSKGKALTWFLTQLQSVHLTGDWLR